MESLAGYRGGSHSSRSRCAFVRTLGKFRSSSHFGGERTCGSYLRSEGIVNVETMVSGQGDRGFVSRNYNASDGINEPPEIAQRRFNLCPIELQFLACDPNEFVENLRADRAAISQPLAGN